MSTPIRFAVRALALLAAGSFGSGTPFAQTFSPKGATGTLTAEYAFSSAGRKGDNYDSREWKINRTVSLQAELAAGAPSPGPTLTPIDPQVMADNARQAERAVGVARDMQPLSNSVEKILAKCGDNEACIERETMKLGFATKMTPTLESAGREIADMSKSPANRYQRWQAQSLKGSYAIDESLRIVHADPICVNHPKMRCTRSETRKGAGAVPPPPAAQKDPRLAAGFSAIEVDTFKNTVTVLLPLPLHTLPIEQTIATDEPEKLNENGKRITPSDAGIPSFKSIAQPITLALKGSLRSQSGTQTYDVADAAGNAGKLTIRWSFAAR